MVDMTQQYRLQRLVMEAAQYRVLHQIYRSDPGVSPKTAALLRDCFSSYRDDAEALRDTW
jgi:hypothetical protein